MIFFAQHNPYYQVQYTTPWPFYSSASAPYVCRQSVQPNGYQTIYTTVTVPSHPMTYCSQGILDSNVIQPQTNVQYINNAATPKPASEHTFDHPIYNYTDRDWELRPWGLPEITLEDIQNERRNTAYVNAKKSIEETISGFWDLISKKAANQSIERV